jgi:uncharacterized integral membrane protein
MRRAKVASALAAILGLVILSFQNPSPVEFRFLWMSIEVPKIMLMVAAGLVGSLVTLVIQYLLRSSRNAPAGGASAGGTMGSTPSSS